MQISKKELLVCDGPLLIAANHPNSFLDAILLCTLFERPIYSLARGDVFSGKLITKILLSLKLLPVYRVSEGVENLEENYKTFDRCKEIFKQNGIVLIFSEGKCINEWHLRPLKKGTARLAISSWADGIPLKVLPVGINYSSFKKFGKNIRLSLGEFITRDAIDLSDSDGKSILYFNSMLQKQLKPFVFEIDKTDKEQLHNIFFVYLRPLKKMMLFLPSITGWLLHAPLYYPVKKFVIKKTNSTDHFDSGVISILFLAYPFYIGFVTLLMYAISRQWVCFLLLFIFPFTAWAHIQLKKQLD